MPQAHTQQSKIPKHDGAARDGETDQMNQVERGEPELRVAQCASELRRFDGLRDLKERHYASVLRRTKCDRQAMGLSYVR